jgi:Cys-tRNA(Pro)/Cys-tRNA(Cys) deacylase
MTSIQELESKQIPYRLAHHDGLAHSAQQAAAVLGVTVSQIVKTLCLVGSTVEPIIVLATGDQKINLAGLRQQLGDTRLHLASPEEVLQVTGYPVGLVTPFGLKTPNVRVFATAQVQLLTSCILSSGHMGVEIELSVVDLLRATNAIIINEPAVV